MTAALRWTGWLFITDVAVLAAIFIGLLVARAVGIDIQALKWSAVSVAVILIGLLVVLSAVGVVLQVFDIVRRRSAR